MPSFDIVSEINLQELDNALNQARKELQQRFGTVDDETLAHASSIRAGGWPALDRSGQIHGSR